MATQLPKRTERYRRQEAGAAWRAVATAVRVGAFAPIGMIVALLPLTACGGTTESPGTTSSGTSSTSAGPTSSVSTPSSLTPSPSPSPPTPQPRATITEADDGRTVTITRGTTLTLILNSTYWTIAPPSGNALVEVAPPSVAPSPGCIPGGGCGTVTQTFTAVATGRVRLTASRTSCGEALRCTWTAGVYSVTVVVLT